MNRDLEATVLETIVHEQLIQKGDHILIGVSGGADSIALLHILMALKKKLSITLAIAHIDHGLRKDSSQDREYVEKIAKKYNLSFYVAIEDLLSQGKTKIEERARQVRYQFLEHTAKKIRASKIAVAHTANDQAETILQRVIKGSGVLGLAGINFKRPISQNSHIILIRPLLSTLRQDLIEHLTANKHSWREDPSNQDIFFERNRIRQLLLPFIKENFQSNIISSLLRMATRNNEIVTFLTQQAEWCYKNAKKTCSKPELEIFFQWQQTPFFTFCSKKFFEVPDALFPFFLKSTGLWNALREKHYLLIRSLKDTSTGMVQLPYDACVIRSHSRVYILKKAKNNFSQPLKISESTTAKTAFVSISMEVLKEYQLQKNKLEEVFSLDSLKLPLKIRPWKQGEKMRLLGSPGLQKISKILSNAHLPKPLRSQVLLITDSMEEPIWLVGVGIGENVKVTAQTKKVGKLKVGKKDSGVRSQNSEARGI